MKQLLTNLANLLKVKTMVTLGVMLTFCLKTWHGYELSNEFIMVTTAVITYYFCKGENKPYKGEWEK